MCDREKAIHFLCCSQTLFMSPLFHYSWLCAHQSPSCFLGPCHPGRNSPAWRPGGPRSKDPGRHPPPGQTGCPELGPAGRVGRNRGTSQTVCFLPCVFRCNGHFQGWLNHRHTVALLYCTSSLLLSRLDIETSSIFICQNYQMNRHCCGHAVAQHTLARTGLQQEGNTVSNTAALPNACEWAHGQHMMPWMWCSYLQLHVGHYQGLTSLVYNLRITETRK